MSILALMAQRDKINLQGMAVRVDKHMSADAPRRICRLDVHLTLPAHLDAATRLKLERAAHTCPVAKSIHPDIALNIETTYR
jgi:uncharacterized OsmC-like protein